MICNFSYDWYKNLLTTIEENGFSFIFFGEESENRKEVVLRHDIDFSIDLALELSYIENQIGVKSTYFLLLCTDFYNPFSKSSIEKIKKIIDNGHQVQLHFDIKAYDELASDTEIASMIEKEMRLLEFITNRKVNVVSFHRPIKRFLGKKISHNFISAYDPNYFCDFLYVSDSRRFWDENSLDKILNSKKAQVLTHAFWYSPIEESAKLKFEKFKHNSIKQMYLSLNDNIKNFKEFMGEDEFSEK